VVPETAVKATFAHAAIFETDGRNHKDIDHCVRAFHEAPCFHAQRGIPFAPAIRMGVLFVVYW
jgi:hypothetical protein